MNRQNHTASVPMGDYKELIDNYDHATSTLELVTPLMVEFTIERIKSHLTVSSNQFMGGYKPGSNEFHTYLLDFKSFCTFRGYDVQFDLKENSKSVTIKSITHIKK